VTESTAEEGICCGQTLVINLCLLLFQEVPLNIGRAGACVVVVKLPWRFRVPELWPQKEVCDVNSWNALFTLFIKAIVNTGFISTDLNNLVQFILFLLRYFSTITDWKKRKIKKMLIRFYLTVIKLYKTISHFILRKKEYFWKCIQTDFFWVFHFNIYILLNSSNIF